MVGHEKNSKDLKDLFARDTLSHGYIFYGPAMVGKRFAARAFANFLERGEFDAGVLPDGQSVVLRDFTIIEPGENSSIGIDAVRDIRNFLWQKPDTSPRRTLVIDDAELLTTEAQNALLKVTEEPPVSSLLILITSDIESILPTITSRLPKIYFGAVSEKEIAQWLISTNAPKKVAEELAEKAMGKPGLAWRLREDGALQEQIALAEKLLKTAPADRRDLIKKIIEPDEFKFRKFLDALVIVLAWRVKRKGTAGERSAADRSAALWHTALQLYERDTNFSLNPRLQLENLLM